MPGRKWRAAAPGGSLVRGVVALLVVAILTGAGIYVAVKSSSSGATSIALTSTNTITADTTTIPVTEPTATEAGLDGHLLSPDDIDTAMGVSGMAVADHSNVMFDVGDFVPDKACLPLASVAETSVYAGSGWTAVSKQELENAQNDHYVGQAVVLFPSGHDADAFFDASTQKWPACSNRRYAFTETEPRSVYTVGPVVNANGTLSVNTTIEATGRICERALTVAANVVIDVAACSFDTKDQAVTIAHQIAATLRTP